MRTPSWISRLILGTKRIAEKEAAERKFEETLNGHRFDPSEMREQIQRIVADVEDKAEALSIPPPEVARQEGEHGRRSSEPDARSEKA